MEFIEHRESGLSLVIRLVKTLLEATAVFCMLVGFVQTGQLAINLNVSCGDRFPLRLVQLRLCFGMWLALALEFQLGTDIQFYPQLLCFSPRVLYTRYSESRRIIGKLKYPRRLN